MPISEKQRTSGILLPIFSLPGGPFFGTLGAEAGRFARFLAESGQQWWQMLPVNPIDPYHSPYASCSAFAGEALFLDLGEWVAEGLLDTEDMVPFQATGSSIAEYPLGIATIEPLWRKAFDRYQSKKGGEKYARVEEKFRQENEFWLDDYLLFRVLADRFETNDWTRWPKEFRDRTPSVLATVRRDQADELAFFEFLQRVFDVQWDSFRADCAAAGVKLIGDVPIYVGGDGAETWAHRALFQLHPDGKPRRISGAPADGFNPDGQRWNSPLYDWDALEATGFDWWIRRLAKTFSRFDAVRLDHFIGFYNYYSFPREIRDRTLPISNDEPTDGLVPITPIDAEGGFWTAGPREKFLDLVFEHFPREGFIAEDLGVMTPGVHGLRDHYCLPGMEVFPFAFDYRTWFDRDPVLGWHEISVACTGTHDTPTLLGWLYDLISPQGVGMVDYAVVAKNCWEHLSDAQQQAGAYGRSMNRYEVRPEDLSLLAHGAVRAVMGSKSRLALVPMQDHLGLAGDARMNYPGKSDNNWRWRLRPEQLSEALSVPLRAISIEMKRGEPSLALRKVVESNQTENL